MAPSYKGFDQILTEYVGGRGRYQLKITLLMTPLYWLTFPLLFLIVFSAYVPPHRCKVSACENITEKVSFYNLYGSQISKHLGIYFQVTSNIFESEWAEFAIPKKQSSTNFLAEKGEFDNCKVFKAISSDCDPSAFSSTETETCQEFVFDNAYFSETLSSKLDLVCDQANKKKLLGTILIFGLLVGSLIGGRIGDQLGRKKASFLSYLVIIPSVIIAGYVNSYAAYAILHFIYSSTLPILWVNLTVYLTEIFQPNWRYAFAAPINLQVGNWILTLIAYLCSTWTMVHVWIGLVCVLVLPIYFFVPESPRWLAQNGKEDEAIQVVLDMAKTNQREINENDKKEIQAIINEIATESKATENQLSPLDIFKHGQMKKVVVLGLAWICVCVSYYALSLNSSKLSGDIYINFFLSRTVVLLIIPSILAPSFFFGLRISFSALQILLGISCITLAFIPRDQTTAVLVFYLFSILVASTCKKLLKLCTYLQYSF